MLLYNIRSCDNKGMESLTYKDRINLLNISVATSLKFQTAQYYGKQFVLCDSTYGRKRFLIFVTITKQPVSK